MLHLLLQVNPPFLSPLYLLLLAGPSEGGDDSTHLLGVPLGLRAEQEGAHSLTDTREYPTRNQKLTNNEPRLQQGGRDAFSSVRFGGADYTCT